MAKTGLRLKSKKLQRLDAELGLIIQEMGQAMWLARKKYIAEYSVIATNPIPMTSHMASVLWNYMEFCRKNWKKYE